LRDKIAEANATIKFDFSLAKKCYCIPAYLDSIFYNLISNAIKYRAPDRDPIITLRSAIELGKMVLTIQDNGSGIDLEKQKNKIFNLYQRFHHNVEGKGMGLFLVKTQIEALHGNIEIESQPNKGTTFRISLPLKEETKPNYL
jgi:signal transduction histidine kinase